MPKSANSSLRLAARYRHATRYLRWGLFACGGIATLGMDSLLVDGDGFPMLPSFGVWLLVMGWLWGTEWLAAAVGFSLVAFLLGLGPPLILALPPLLSFTMASLILRNICPVAHPLWGGRYVAISSCVGAFAAILAAIPYAMETVWQFGAHRLNDPMLWLRTLAVPGLSTLAWLFFFGPVYRAVEPKVITSSLTSRWGWPERSSDVLGILGLGLGVAMMLALSPPIEQWPWALIAAILMVLASALIFNLFGGVVCALMGCLGSSLAGGLDFITSIDVANTHMAHSVLIIIGLVAGSFASRARTRQDEWAHNVQRYKELLDSLPIGLVEINERGLITQANPMAGTIVGCEPVDLLGHPFDRLGDKESRDALAETTRAIRYRRQQGARFLSNFLYRPDKTSRDVQVDWVYQSSRKYSNNKRGPMRVTALLTDVTDSRRAMRALKEREFQLASRSNLLRITMDSLDHGLAVFRPDNTLTEWNARFPEMLRLPSPLSRRGTPAIAIYRFLATLGAFGVGVTEAQVRERMDLLLTGANQDDIPWIGRQNFRFTSHTMPDGGWVWRVEDRTEDLRLQDVEQNRQKMEALGQLASGVAHELNNTLQPVFSLSELGAAHVGDNAILAKCFARITDAAERAEGIVRGVLTFARNAPVAAENCQLLPAIHDSLALIRAGVSAQIRLDISVDDAIPAEAMAHIDRRELGQVLTNLITNAADAMDHKGTIQVRCRNDILRIMPEGDSPDLCEIRSPAVAISVIDTGKGMDALTRQRIFEPFYTTKGEGHGTGLGLAVAFGLVRDWGGRIDVESEEGLGSSFTVWVPILVDGPGMEPDIKAKTVVF